MFTALYMAYSTWGKGTGEPIIFICCFLADYPVYQAIVTKVIH